MDFELSQDHKVLQAAVRDFVEKEIKPIAVKIDEEHAIPDALVKKMGEMGFLGSYFPEQYGGAGLDMLSYVIVVEEVSKACASSGVLISAHSSLAANPIYAFGTEEQKQKWLPPLNRGELIGCLLLTESGAGSDAGGIATMYKREGGRVCHQRQQNLHHQRRLPGHRNRLRLVRPLAKAQGDQRLYRRSEIAGRRGLEERKQDGHPRHLHHRLRPGQPPRAGREPAGQGRQGVQRRYGHLERRADRHRLAGPGHRRRGLPTGTSLLQGAQAVRSADQRVPGDPVQAGRYVRPDRDQQADDLQGRLARRTTR